MALPSHVIPMFLHLFLLLSSEFVKTIRCPYDEGPGFSRHREVPPTYVHVPCEAILGVGDVGDITLGVAPAGIKVPPQRRARIREGTQDSRVSRAE